MFDVVLDFTPQAFKSCPCPASRVKKEPRISNRDISGLMDGETYISEARSWSDTPVCMAAGRQDKAAVFIGGRGREF